jgi:colanic acid/amylovoran biosynthesis glycosyltransferase
MRHRTHPAYILSVFPALYQPLVLNEVLAWRALGHPISVFSLRQPDPGQVQHQAAGSITPSVMYCWQSRQSRLSVLRANLALISRAGATTYRASWELARDSQLIRNLQAFMRFAYWPYELKRRGVTHLHAHWATEATTVAMIFSWLSGLPFSFTAHAYDIFVDPQYLDRKLEEARFAITVSEYNKQYLMDKYGSDYEGKIHIIRPVVDIRQFTPRPRCHEQRHQLNILSVGRLVEKKGYVYLIEACRILRQRGIDLVCRIAGEGADRPLLEDAVRRYGLETCVHFPGNLPHEAIQQLLEQATVFVLPCVIAQDGDRDATPQVLAEAMAREVPVISTTIVGLGELIRDGAGLLVPPRDAQALADAIERVWSIDEKTREAMGKAGRRIVELEFDPQKAVMKLLTLMNKGPRSDV